MQTTNNIQDVQTVTTKWGTVSVGQTVVNKSSASRYKNDEYNVFKIHGHGIGIKDKQGREMFRTAEMFFTRYAVKE